MKTYKYPIVSLLTDQVFVFGSNTQGLHGKGAALWAYKNAGAIYGKPRGFQGQSYAIITKDLTQSKHPSIKVKDISSQIEQLYREAQFLPNLEFLIAYADLPNTINLNGYKPYEMAEMFGEFPIPDNIVFEENFSKLVENSKGQIYIKYHNIKSLS